MVLSWAKSQDPIGGPGVIVEADETHWCKRKYNRGRDTIHVWIFGAVERGTNRKVIMPLTETTEAESYKRDSATLIPIIKKYIREGSTIMTDCWKAYDCLKNEGYVHQTVNHRKEFVRAGGEIHTQKIERAWGDMKSWSKRRGNSVDNLEQYVGRYLFCRKDANQSMRLHDFLCSAAELYPPAHQQEKL